MARSELFFLIIFSLFSTVCQAEEVKAGMITASLGLVTARKVGVENAVELNIGDEFAVGELVQTGKNSSAQLTFEDGSFIDLGQQTSLRIDLYIYERVDTEDREPDVRRKKSVIRLIEGRARFVVLKKVKETSLYRVETDHALIEAPAADFVVGVLPEETEVVVLAKGVKVSNISFLIPASVQLRTNQRSTVRKKSPPSQPSPVTPQQRKFYTGSNSL